MRPISCPLHTPNLGHGATLRWPIPLLFLVCLGVTGHAESGKLYRWVDQNGEVHYSDVIPPEQSGQGHSQLDRAGIERQAVPPPQSREDYLREQETNRLRAEQQKLAEEQEAADRLLLQTYDNEDEILLARNGKLAAVDAAVNVTHSNLHRHKRELTRLQSEAAGYERRGSSIPAKLRDRLDETERAIAAGYESIVRQEQRKDEIRAEFDEILHRFRELQRVRTPGVAAGENALGPVRTFADLDNILVCENDEACAEPWARAKAYVEQNATTPLQLFGPRIHMTAPASGDQDISIAVSWIPEPESPGSVLFMDLQCSKTPHGKALCASPKVEGMRNGFKAFVLQKP